MSNSTQLSLTRTGNVIANESSKRQEQYVKAAVEMVRRKLKREFPEITFKWETSLSKREIGSKLNKIDPSLGQFLSADESYIKPDGGFLFGFFKGKKKLILCVEAKKQGTNDIRIAKGLGNQAKGNAIERSSKTYCEVANLQLNEVLFPYLIFMSGCDFADGSTIIDRVTSMNYQSEINRLYIHKKKVKLSWGKTLIPVASLFIRKRQWGAESIAKICYEAAEISIAHYME